MNMLGKAEEKVWLSVLVYMLAMLHAIPLSPLFSLSLFSLSLFPLSSPPSTSPLFSSLLSSSLLSSSSSSLLLLPPSPPPPFSSSLLSSSPLLLLPSLLLYSFSSTFVSLPLSVQWLAEEEADCWERQVQDWRTDHRAGPEEERGTTGSLWEGQQGQFVGLTVMLTCH